MPPAARRVHPMSRVKLYGPQRQVALKYDGFGQNDMLADLQKRGELTVRPAAGYQWPSLIGGAHLPGAMTIAAGGLDTTIARPLLDLSQPIGLGHFSPIAGKWSALAGLGLGSQVRLYQYDGTPNRTTGIQSNFRLPTNPIFAVSLYRAHVAHDHDWAGPPYTEVHFSVGATGEGAAREWAIAIPYGEPMLLLRHDQGRWAKVAESDAGLYVPSLSGMARGQSATLWIGTIRGHIAISTDGFVSQIWTHRLPPDEVVASGKVGLWHNAGQWAVAFCPIVMHGSEIHGPPISAGYDTGDCAAEPLLSWRHTPVVDDRRQVLHAVHVEDSTADSPALPADMRTWKATLTPYRVTEYEVGTDPHSGDPVDFSTCVSPQLHSVQIGQWPELTVGAAPDHEELSTRLISLQAGQRIGTSAAHCRLLFDNQDGALSDFAEYRRMEVSLGWRMDDDSEALVPLLSGYSAEPQVSVAPGGRGRLQVELLDPMVRLRDEKCDGRAPVFDGWTVRQAFAWVLGRCGIDDSEMALEDTGMRLSSGSPEQPLWEAEPGRPWVELLAQLAAYDHNAALFFDAEGRFVKACGHCRQPRSAEDVTAHDGSASGACDCTIAWELYTRPAAAPATQTETEAQEAGDGDDGEPEESALAATMHAHSTPAAAQGTDADAQPEAAPTAEAQGAGDGDGDGDGGEPQESALDATMHGHSTPAIAHSIDADTQPEATPATQTETEAQGEGDGDGGEPQESALAAAMQGHSAPAAAHSTDADAQPEAAPAMQAEAQGDGDGDGGEPQEQPEPDAGAHDPGPGEILRLERLAESLATADYRNYIMVAGADAHGRAVRAVACDADSVHEPGSPRYVGWRKMEVYELAGVTGQAEANALAAELLAQLSPSPEHVALITPLEAGLRVGQVLRIHGGERAGVSGAIYRIVRVEHRVQRAPHRLAYSSIQARAVPE